MLHSTSPATTPAPPTTTPTAPSTTGSSRWLIGWSLVPDLEHFRFWADQWWLLVRRQYRLRGGLRGGLQQVTNRCHYLRSTNAVSLLDSNLDDDCSCAKIIWNRHGFEAWWHLCCEMMWLRLLILVCTGTAGSTIARAPTSSPGSVIASEYRVVNWGRLKFEL